MFITSVFKQLSIRSSIAITLLLVCSRSFFLLTSQRNHDSTKQSHYIMLMDLAVQKFRQGTDACLLPGVCGLGWNGFSSQGLLKRLSPVIIWRLQPSHLYLYLRGWAQLGLSTGASSCDCNLGWSGF